MTPKQPSLPRGTLTCDVCGRPIWDLASALLSWVEDFSQHPPVADGLAVTHKGECCPKAPRTRELQAVVARPRAQAIDLLGAYHFDVASRARLLELIVSSWAGRWRLTQPNPRPTTSSSTPAPVQASGPSSHAPTSPHLHKHSTLDTEGEVDSRGQRRP